MKIYKCPRCNYSTHILTIYIRHLKRKKICEPILSKTNLQKEYLKYDIKDKLILPQNTTLKTTKNVELHKIPQNTTKNNQCKYCDKVFSRIDSLTRHYVTCKDKKKTDEANENMLELVNLLNEQKLEFKNELEKKNNQIDELIKKAGINNSTITQNIQNNIKLLAYDKTDLSDLTEKDFIRCFNHNNMCVPHLVKRIHFNPKKPENHNVFISNLKSGHIMIYDGIQWNTYVRDEVVNDIFDDKHDILEQKIEEWISIGKDYPIIYHKFKRYLEKINNDLVIKKVKDELKLTLYNNRNIVKKLK